MSIADAVVPSFVETLSAWSTTAAAIATAVSVAFIAWQIRLTRKSVEATEAALQIARDEFRHGQRLRVDAQRAAIDAEMPRLTVEVSRQSFQVWRDDIEVTDSYGDDSYPGEVPVGSEFVYPRDGNVPLRVSLQVSISNDGPRRARLSARQPEKDEEIVVKVGSTYDLWISYALPLSKWVEIAEDREVGNPGEERRALALQYMFPGDTGAVEEHIVLHGGSIVEPVPDNAGGWRIASFEPSFIEPFGSVHAAVQPFTRRYWSSRLHGRSLDSGRDDD